MWKEEQERVTADHFFLKKTHTKIVGVAFLVSTHNCVLNFPHWLAFAAGWINMPGIV